MNTQIEYLKQLETDLKDAAARETARMERATLQGAIRKNTGRGWTKVVGVAAAFLVVAGAIGFLAQGGLMSSADGGGPSSFRGPSGQARWQTQSRMTGSARQAAGECGEHLGAPQVRRAPIAPPTLPPATRQSPR